MVKAHRNHLCRDNPKNCWTCWNDGKHHTSKDGAEKCCTKEKSLICKCRHCKEKEAGQK